MSEPLPAPEARPQRTASPARDAVRPKRLTPRTIAIAAAGLLLLAAAGAAYWFAARLAGERKQMERMASGRAQRIFTFARLTVPPIGLAELSKLVGKTSPVEAAHA